MYGHVPVWADELDYGPVTINGQYNQPVTTVQDTRGWTCHISNSIHRSSKECRLG